MHVALPFIIGNHDDSLKIPLDKLRVFSIGNGTTNFHIKEDSGGESGTLFFCFQSENHRLGSDSMGTPDDEVAF